MGSIDWADVLRGALAFFLVVVGIGIAYVCFRLGGMLGRMSLSVVRVTDEVVPILNRAQGTVDGINLELARVDEIMVSAVNATKGAEKTVTSLSHAVTSPVKKASGFAAAAKEAMATFRARRAAGVNEAEETMASAAPAVAEPVASFAATPEPAIDTPAGVGDGPVDGALAGAKDAIRVVAERVDAAREAARDASGGGSRGAVDGALAGAQVGLRSAAARVEQIRNGSSAVPDEPITSGESTVRRGPSQSQIDWALPKGRS